MNLSKVVSGIIEVSKEAGAKILEIYDNPALFNVENKDDKSPLTAADKAANKIICDFLEKNYPEIPIISEENKLLDYSVRKDYTKCWLVDPLDGTKEFIKRNGEFTVNVALIENGSPVLGVVYAPVGDELYYATKGDGAFSIINDDKKQLSANQFKLSDSGLGLLCSRSHLNEDTQAYVDKFDKPNLVSKGSSFKFMLVASGEAHIYPRLAPTMEWDTGAAHIVLEEAGGKVIDQETMKPLKYNKENLRNPYFIAFGDIQE